LAQVFITGPSEAPPNEVDDKARALLWSDEILLQHYDFDTQVEDLSLKISA